MVAGSKPQSKKAAPTMLRADVKATLNRNRLRAMHSSTHSALSTRARYAASDGDAVASRSPCRSTARAERDHTVEPGQTLARIASRYGVSVSSLAAANGVARSAALRPGKC